MISQLAAMQLETALLVGVMTAVSVYLIMEASFARILFGFLLLSNAANVFLLSVSGAPDGAQPPVLTINEALNGKVQYVDPLPQALVLTAIVIGFGVMTYLIFLLYRIFVDAGTTSIAVFQNDRKNKAPGGGLPPAAPPADKGEQASP